MEEKDTVAKLNFYDLVLLLAKWRKLFIVNFVVVVLITVIIVLRMTVWYSASAVILPPTGGGTGLSAFLPSDLKEVASSFGLDMPSGDIFQTILKSRTLKERLIDKFDVRENYNMAEDVFFEDLLKTFEAHYDVTTRDDNTIIVTVEDKSPERSAAMANEAVRTLDQIYSQITSDNARANRIYIGERLEKINDSLNTLQDSIIAFQNEYKAISITNQTMATIEAASELKAQQIAAEIEIEIMRNSFGADHPTIDQLKSASQEYGKKYNDILYGKEGDLFLSLNDLPKLGRDYADLLRKAKIQSTLIEYIYPQYEAAKIQEDRETSNIQLIDPAKVPNRKAKPPRRLIVTVAAVASLIGTLVLVLLFEYWKSIPEKNPHDWKKIQEIGSTLKRKRS